MTWDYRADYYIRMAKAGVNILQATPTDDGGYLLIVEYSWDDPRQQHKLHWSKVAYLAQAPEWPEHLLGLLAAVREELEG